MINYGFLEEIPASCGKNLSGVQELWLMEYEFLQGYTQNDLSATDLLIHEEGGFKKIPMLKDNCFVNENSQESPYGSIIEWSLKFSLAKDTSATRNMANKILGRQLAVAYLDRNGEYRLMPKAKCLPAQKTDQKGGRNSFDFNLIKKSAVFSLLLPNGIANTVTVTNGDFYPPDFYLEDFYTS